MSQIERIQKYQKELLVFFNLSTRTIDPGWEDMVTLLSEVINEVEDLRAQSLPVDIMINHDKLIEIYEMI